MGYMKNKIKTGGILDVKSIVTYRFEKAMENTQLIINRVFNLF